MAFIAHREGNRGGGDLIVFGLYLGPYACSTDSSGLKNPACSLRAVRYSSLSAKFWVQNLLQIRQNDTSLPALQR